MSHLPELHILTEYSPFSMGFVLITQNDHAVIIDGGRSQELHNVAAHVKDRPVDAWILTHPHGDHIGCINHALKTAHPMLNSVKEVICNFHSYDFYRQCGCSEEELQPLKVFHERKAPIEERIRTVQAGDTLKIDGLKFEFLFSRDEKYIANSVNDSSLVFRVTGPEKKVLFLADLGPVAGADLLERYGDALKSDVVQMAHHGHMCVGEEVYRAIAPTVCIWCAASWLYVEPDIEISPGMYGVAHTRHWMQELGVLYHIVTKDGDQILNI